MELLKRAHLNLELLRNCSKLGKITPQKICLTINRPLTFLQIAPYCVYRKFTSKGLRSYQKSMTSELINMCPNASLDKCCSIQLQSDQNKYEQPFSFHLRITHFCSISRCQIIILKSDLPELNTYTVKTNTFKSKPVQ